MKKISFIYFNALLFISLISVSHVTLGQTGQHHQIFGPRQVSCDLNAFYWTDLTNGSIDDGILAYQWSVTSSSGYTLPLPNTTSPYLSFTFPNVAGIYTVALYVQLAVFDTDSEGNLIVGYVPIYSGSISVFNDINAGFSQSVNYLYGHYYGEYIFQSTPSNSYWQTFPNYSPMVASQAIYLGGSTAPAGTTDVQPDYGGTFVHASARIGVHAPNIYMQPGFIVEQGAIFHASTLTDCATLVASPVLQRTAAMDSDKSDASTTINTDNYKKAYPNPTTGSINIPIVNAAQSTQIAIYNSLGVEIYKNTVSSKGFSVVTVDLSKYDSGMYVVKSVSDNNTTVQQIVLEK